MPRRADLTLADFWGIEHIDPQMDEDKGTSLVLVNSPKGKKLLDSLGASVVKKEFTLEEARKGNRALENSLVAAGDNRADFSEIWTNYLLRKWQKDISQCRIGKKIQGEIQNGIPGFPADGFFRKCLEEFLFL